MTPISNPRHVDYSAATPSLLYASPSPAINSHSEIAPNEDGPTDEGIGELLQTTATSQGRLNYYYTKFVSACQKASSILRFVGVTSHTVPIQITFLEGQQEEIQREFDLTKRKLDETEQRLREANVDKGKLKKWGDTLVRRVDSIYKQLGLLRVCNLTSSNRCYPNSSTGNDRPRHRRVLSRITGGPRSKLNLTAYMYILSLH